MQKPIIAVAAYETLIAMNEIEAANVVLETMTDDELLVALGA